MTTRAMIWRSAKTAVSVLVLLAIIVAAVLAVLTRLQDGQFLSVQTGSMSPVIRQGDLVVVVPAATSAIKRGDIVTFRSPRDSNKTITHRVVATPSSDEKIFLTKGDANTANDQPVSPGAIIGSVAYSVPKLGYLTDFIRKPIGLALLIYVPALLIIAAEMRRLARYYRKQQPYIAVGYRRSR